MARVSDDHANESMFTGQMDSQIDSQRRACAPAPRPISSEEVRQHGESGSFWAVIDGFVVDASEFVDTHPGGLKKLLSADSPSAGATGRPFGFSFSRGKNAHFPATGRTFHDGVQRFLRGSSREQHDDHLPPADVAFPPFGKIVILGRLSN